MDPLLQHTRLVKDCSKELGFDYCGIAKAAPLDEDARRLEAWLSKGMHGNMHYMEHHFDLRVDPTKLVPGARSVITLLMNYFPSRQQQTDGPKISKYAYGDDYHEVIRARLNTLLQRLREQVGEINGRGFVDSAPVLERSWARKSGLGWVGKNGNLLVRGAGSFYFIATLITDLPLLYDDPYTADFCGTCTRCLDACPTGAILPGKVVDGSRCISYFTIELKEALIPDEMKGQFQDWIFGCDTCQDVCPWNRFSKPHQQEAFTPLPEILNLSTREWEHFSEEQFRQVFKHSPLKRTKLKGVQRNLKFIRE
ncbi:tRNA epoxyqueuosine(34) reductase QueG [Niabella beijingensis]|uniref:tRNA epoxyqueuosine(34) reductase QueG n=1 Tax=Niabella beijingensis TaxID=2872700 RepID=UPI001CBEE556|nr:tRNA epoxyqueuosine(34) reductase QueG [Niabella beijingensis]MBZ4190716.1 tRNA epoxyqueuosine(34) reductase QueG [Niabella beijingensis]